MIAQTLCLEPCRTFLRETALGGAVLNAATSAATVQNISRLFLPVPRTTFSFPLRGRRCLVPVRVAPRLPPASPYVYSLLHPSLVCCGSTDLRLKPGLALVASSAWFFAGLSWCRGTEAVARFPGRSVSFPLASCSSSACPQEIVSDSSTSAFAVALDAVEVSKSKLEVPSSSSSGISPHAPSNSILEAHSTSRPEGANIHLDWSLADLAIMDPWAALQSVLLVVFAAILVSTVLFGIFVAVGVLFQPRWIISFVRQRIPHIVFEHVTQDKLVALTIDDGPNGGATNEILDILKANGCKATFFVIGANVDKWPELVERMCTEGHEVGNHTMEDVASWRLSLDTLEMSLLEVDRKLQPFFRVDHHGNQIKWFRPGHGWSTKPIRELAESHGYRLALGSVFPVDPLFKESGRPLADYCLWKVYPGAIMILHDRPPQQNQTIEILRRMLPELRRRGYQVVTLTELTLRTHSAVASAECCDGDIFAKEITVQP